MKPVDSETQPHTPPFPFPAHLARPPNTQKNFPCWAEAIFFRPCVKPTIPVNSDGKLGTVVSSARYKDNVQPMDKASEAILALKPVTFRYKKELDPDGIPQFGLVAEEVEKINPDLVARDEQGKPYTVRYEAVNAMLLNEFLKAHRTMEHQKTTIAQLESTDAEQRQEINALAAAVKEQAARIQKVSAQLEASKPAPQMVLNN